MGQEQGDHHSCRKDLPLCNVQNGEPARGGTYLGVLGLLLESRQRGKSM